MSSAGSPGLSISGADTLLLFDLDGTLLQANSFPLWARYMLAGRFGGLRAGERLGLTLRTLVALARRKLLRQPHAQTKRQLQFLWAQALAKDGSQQALEHFTDLLLMRIRPQMKPVLEAMARSCAPAILATAAAAEYAVPLGGKLGFASIIATPAYGSASVDENVGQRKCDAILSHCREQGWQDRKWIFFTDHTDDLPGMKRSAMVFWFGAGHALGHIRAAAHGARVVPSLALTGEEILVHIHAFAADA